MSAGAGLYGDLLVGHVCDMVLAELLVEEALLPGSPEQVCASSVLGTSPCRQLPVHKHVLRRQYSMLCLWHAAQMVTGWQPVPQLPLLAAASQDAEGRASEALGQQQQ